MANALIRVGYLLALIGGVIIIVFGLLGLLGVAFRIFSPLAFLSSAVFAVIEIVIGVVCVIGSKFVSRLDWAIILLILGIIAGSLGGTLVVLGALLGILSRIIKP
jgi:hypothetical protein